MLKVFTKQFLCLLFFPRFDFNISTNELVHKIANYISGHEFLNIFKITQSYSFQNDRARFTIKFK